MNDRQSRPGQNRHSVPAVIRHVEGSCTRRAGKGRRVEHGENRGLFQVNAVLRVTGSSEHGGGIKVQTRVPRSAAPTFPAPARA